MPALIPFSRFLTFFLLLAVSGLASPGRPASAAPADTTRQSVRLDFIGLERGQDYVRRKSALIAVRHPQPLSLDIVATLEKPDGTREDLVFRQDTSLGLLVCTPYFSRAGQYEISIQVFEAGSEDPILSEDRTVSIVDALPQSEDALPLLEGEDVSIDYSRAFFMRLREALAAGPYEFTKAEPELLALQKAARAEYQPYAGEIESYYQARQRFNRLSSGFSQRIAALTGSMEAPESSNLPPAVFRNLLNTTHMRLLRIHEIAMAARLHPQQPYNHPFVEFQRVLQHRGARINLNPLDPYYLPRNGTEYELMAQALPTAADLEEALDVLADFLAYSRACRKQMEAAVQALLEESDEIERNLNRLEGNINIRQLH